MADMNPIPNLSARAAGGRLTLSVVMAKAAPIARDFLFTPR